MCSTSASKHRKSSCPQPWGVTAGASPLVVTSTGGVIIRVTLPGTQRPMRMGKLYRRWCLGSVQAFLFILLVEDHARLKAIFKNEIMKPEFKLADTSLMREVELLQQSAAFLFGAGVVAGYTASPEKPDPLRLWAFWGIIAASLLFAVLSAFFARMMASMLWSLAKDYLDRLAPVFDQLYPHSSRLTDMLNKWDKKEAARQAALADDDIIVAAGIEVVAAAHGATGQTLPGGQHRLDTDTSSEAVAAGCDDASNNWQHTAAGSARGAAAGGIKDNPSVGSATMASNNKKAQVKQLIYWNALSPALKPGIQTIRAFIFITKACFLFAVWLWLIVFMVIAKKWHPHDARSTLVIFAACCVWFAVVTVMSCMVRYVFAVFRSYHKPQKGVFWPDNWKTTFTFDEAPKQSKQVLTRWGYLRQGVGCLFGIMQAAEAGAVAADLAESAASGSASNA